MYLQPKQRAGGVTRNLRVTACDATRAQAASLCRCKDSFAAAAAGVEWSPVGRRDLEALFRVEGGLVGRPGGRACNLSLSMAPLLSS